MTICHDFVGGFVCLFHFNVLIFRSESISIEREYVLNVMKVLRRKRNIFSRSIQRFRILSSSPFSSSLFGFRSPYQISCCGASTILLLLLLTSNEKESCRFTCQLWMMKTQLIWALQEMTLTILAEFREASRQFSTASCHARRTYKTLQNLSLMQDTNRRIWKVCFLHAQNASYPCFKWILFELYTSSNRSMEI